VGSIDRLRRVTVGGTTIGAVMTEPCSAEGTPVPTWTPPIWLRRLDAVVADAESWRDESPERKFLVTLELMSFGLARLREQAERRGCSVAELHRLYEQASARLRVRA
jgi:hypothetical protein